MNRKILQIILAIITTTVLVLGAVIGGMIYMDNLKTKEEEATVLEQETDDNTYTIADLEEATTEPDTSIYVQGSGTGDTYTPTTEEELAYEEYMDQQVTDTTAIRSTALMYANTDTNVYSEMSLDSEVLGRVVFNQELAVYGNVDGWFVIQYGEKDGYIPEAYVASVKQQNIVEKVEKTETPQIVESKPAPAPVQEVTPPAPSTEIVDSDTNAGVPVPSGGSGEDSDEAIRAALEAAGITGHVTGNGTVINPNATPADVDGILTEEEKEHTKDWVWH